MLGRRQVALDSLEAGDGILLIEWSAPAAAAIDDPEVWRAGVGALVAAARTHRRVNASTPHWRARSTSRRTSLTRSSRSGRNG